MSDSPLSNAGPVARTLLPRATGLAASARSAASVAATIATVIATFAACASLALPSRSTAADDNAASRAAPRNAASRADGARAGTRGVTTAGTEQVIGFIEYAPNGATLGEFGALALRVVFAKQGGDWTAPCADERVPTIDNACVQAAGAPGRWSLIAADGGSAARAAASITTERASAVRSPEHIGLLELSATAGGRLRDISAAPRARAETLPRQAATAWPIPPLPVAANPDLVHADAAPADQRREPMTAAELAAAQREFLRQIRAAPRCDARGRRINERPTTPAQVDAPASLRLADGTLIIGLQLQRQLFATCENLADDYASRLWFAVTAERKVSLLPLPRPAGRATQALPLFFGDLDGDGQDEALFAVASAGRAGYALLHAGLTRAAVAWWADR